MLTTPNQDAKVYEQRVQALYRLGCNVGQRKRTEDARMGEGTLFSFQLLTYQ